MIKLSNLKVTYNGPGGGIEALKGINLEVRRGEIVGIIGYSGAGKSTLVRCINMLERPTGGTVVVDGRELTAMSDGELREMRKDIGMIFQHFNLLSSATVYDNIAFPLRLSNTPEDKIRAKVMPLLELVGLTDKKDNYPAQLSGGQKQRVGIARALASEPKVLLSDEATSALDPQTTKAILELIKDINKKLGLTVVVITHEMQVIRDICERVAVLDDGVIVEEGSVIDVFTAPQAAITREFVSAVLSDELPTAFRHSPLSPTPIGADNLLLLRLTFIGESADDPVIAAVIRSFAVDITILYGSLGAIQATQYGRMIIGMSGAADEVERALAYIRQRDLRVEVIGYVERSDRAAD